MTRKTAFNKFKSTDGSYQLANAYALAHAANLAYRSPATIIKVARTDWKFKTSKFFDSNDQRDTQAFVAEKPGFILVAFRAFSAYALWQLL